MGRASMISTAVLLALGTVMLPPLAAAAEAPSAAERATLTQRLGDPLPLETRFTASDGSRRPLGAVFGERPVVLLPAWLECPHLCGLQLRALARTLERSGLVPGEDLELLVLSIDPRAEATLAARVRSELAGGDGNGWHVLTGTETAIRSVTDAMGYDYAWDPRAEQYAHPAGLVVATPDGRIARVLYGLGYSPRDLRLAVHEAAGGDIGSPVDAVLLRCFAYDPQRGRYTLEIMALLRAGAAITVLLVAGGVGTLLWRERRRRTP